MIPELEKLRSAGALSALDEHFAETLGRLTGEKRGEVLLAAGLASRRVGAGHVCLDLPRFVTEGSLLAEGSRLIEGSPLDEGGEPQWDPPTLEAWLEILSTSEMIECLDAGPSPDWPAALPSSAPLVLDSSGRLYLRRYWSDEKSLAQGLRARIAEGQGAAALDEAVLGEGLDRLFGEESAPGSDLQRRAAEGALRSRFFVISGGPGTGKTSTVIKILALLAEQALAQGEAPPRVQMVAPTGKAAAHLQGSVQRSLEALDCAEAVKAAVPIAASTIHRCLGRRGGTAHRFRHGADNPLELDVLLVDEASMVDLALMTRLVEALPAEARLILLGDRDQLASVEAGSVLGDIGRGPGGEPVDAPDSVVHLTRNYRFSSQGGLEELTRLINAGDAPGTLALLADEDRPEVRLVEPSPGGGWGEALSGAIRSGYAEFCEQTSPEGRMRALDGFRVLCAHRRGRGGVDALNAEAERLLGLGGSLDLAAANPPVRPIGIIRNDYELELYNGDVGIVCSDPEAPERGPRVFFLAPDGSARWYSPLSIGVAETVFATTVHKSQGSEFAEVAVVLPEEASPILSRELIYTAVSRARERVTLFSSAEVLSAAIGRRIERSSGLSEALWG